MLDGGNHRHPILIAFVAAFVKFAIEIEVPRMR
jgi:hypothetical protein